jgi:hypothetical protein
MAKVVPFPEKITPFEEVEAMAKRRRGFKVSKSIQLNMHKLIPESLS